MFERIKYFLFLSGVGTQISHALISNKCVECIPFNFLPLINFSRAVAGFSSFFPFGISSICWRCQDFEIQIVSPGHF